MQKKHQENAKTEFNITFCYMRYIFSRIVELKWVATRPDGGFSLGAKSPTSKKGILKQI